MLAASPDLSGIGVLVVDDDEDTRTILAKYLRYLGAEVAVASDGADALAALRFLRPDAVVSDIAMPSMDGLDLLAHIRMLPGQDSHPTPSIAFTGYSDQGYRARAEAVGFDVFVPKPADPVVIATSIRQLVGARKKLGR
jgi:CheY-like chemotaxis protein